MGNVFRYLDGDVDFVVNRNRCELDVHIEPNLSPYDREFHIFCTHVQDTDAFAVLNIIQPSDIYELEISSTDDEELPMDYVNKLISDVIKEQQEYDALDDETKEQYMKIYTLTLQKEITQPFNNETENPSNYNFYEEKHIKVNAVGGSKHYDIKSILKFHNEEVENDDSEDDENTPNNVVVKQTNFDNGFVYTLFDKNEDDETIPNFVLRNYGMPFMCDSDYYEITFCHRDFRELMVKLKIIYQGNRRRVIAKNNAIEETPTLKPQYHDVYLPLSELKKKMEEKATQPIERKVNEYEIKFLEDVGEKYIVRGKPSVLTIPFGVYENNEESNLMVSVHSTGNWCDVITDDTNRNLLIKITNNPICERRSYIKLFIIDHQKTYKDFTLINKPC